MPRRSLLMGSLPRKLILCLSIESLRRIFLQDAQKDIQLGRRRVKTGGVPLGYVEDFDEPRTTLEGFFSILLLGEVFRQRYLNLVSFDPYEAAGDDDVRILRSFAGLYIESPSVLRTFDDVAIQMAFSEWSSRMRTGVVDGVEGSVDIK